MQGREALRFENTGVLWLTIMSNACERPASSGGADSGNVRRSRLLCYIPVFQGCHPHRSNIHNAPLPLIFVYDSKIALRICELKYMLLILWNVYVEQDNWRWYLQCIDFLRWYPVQCDPAMVFTRYSYCVKLLLCFTALEFLQKADIWTEAHGNIKFILRFKTSKLAMLG
jgi:hypothetical protein